MKTKRLLSTLLKGSLAVLAGVFLYAGSASADIAFPEECADCHGPEPKYQMKGAQFQYANSGHALGFDKHEQHSWYANGGGCQQCHTNEGFIEYTKLGKIESEYIEWPSQPGCHTCHDPHTKGDFSLRKSDPVTLVNGAVADIGKGNLCVNCHTARRGPEVVVPTLASKVSGHFGPHYGTQSNLFVGSGAFEFAGKTYTNSEHRIEVKDGCIDCHMPLPEGRYGGNGQLGMVGGHTFFIGNKDHDGNVTLLTASCESCHKGIKQGKGTNYFNIPAGDDYDGDGVVEAAQIEVEGLLKLLVNSDGTGAMQQGANPMYTAEGEWNVIKDAELERSTNEMAALFNYKFFKSDRSMGVHNMPYTIQVLMDTISALDPSFDTSTRPE